MGAQPATARRSLARRIERRSFPYYRRKEIRPRMSILSYTFFQNALLGSLLASILCGLIGTYIVARRLVFISGGITHASFGGIGHRSLPRIFSHTLCQPCFPYCPPAAYNGSATAATCAKIRPSPFSGL